MACELPVRQYDHQGKIIEVACRKCLKCLQVRETDMCGRAYAEALTSDSFVALTLTYADSNSISSQVLDYTHVQNCLKRLRSAGYKVRYINAGEYGEERGRAHWHMVLYFVGKAPKFPPADMEKQMWSYWPHGFTFVQQPDYYGVRYVVGYTIKDVKSGKSVRRPQMSKKPPLGNAYWKTLAKARISEGLPFASRYYLPNAEYKNGNAVKFTLERASFRDAYWVHVAEYKAAGKAGLPPVAHFDFREVDKILMQDVKPRDFAHKCFSFHDVCGFQALTPSQIKKRVDRILVCPYGHAVVMTNGVVILSKNERGVITRWPASRKSELLAFVRGRHITTPQEPLSLIGSKAPF